MDPSGSPLLSFLVPIRNSEKVLPRLLDSLLAQDFSDFEIIVSDNASTDRTSEVAQAYARKDRRVRYHQNPENIGINANFNQLIDMARGKYMRWIGGDDYLEPEYASKCIAALQSRPDAIGVTTYQDFTDDEGNLSYYEYDGRRLDYSRPYQRYGRMLWFMVNDYRYIDPIYTMMRREVLQKIGGHRHVLSADQVMAVEISLEGPFIHIPECLAHRGWKHAIEHHAYLRRLFHHDYHKVCRHTYLNTLAAFWAPVMRTPMPWWERLMCLPPLVYCFLKMSQVRLKNNLRKALRPFKQALLWTFAGLRNAGRDRSTSGKRSTVPLTKIRMGNSQ
jgi:glycosyltransferase involved in cell wall biosynthesis